MNNEVRYSLDEKISYDIEKVVDIQDEEDEEQEGKWFSRSDKFQLIAFAIFGILLFIAITKFNLLEKLIPFFQFIQDHPVEGIILHLILIQVIGIFCIPIATFIFIAGGIIFRPLHVAIMINMFGVLLSAVIETYLGIYIFQSWAKQKLASTAKLKKFSIVVRESGFWMTVMLRQVIPFPIGSYLFPSLEVRPDAYVIGTFFCAIAHAVPDTFIGSLLTNLFQITEQGPQDVRLKYSILLLTFTSQIAILVGISVWSNAAMKLVVKGHMSAPMGYDKLTRRQKIIILVSNLGLAVVSVAGIVVLYTIPVFKHM